MPFTQEQVDNAEAIYAEMVRDVTNGSNRVSYDDVAAQERRIAYMKANMTGSANIVRQIQVRVGRGY